MWNEVTATSLTSYVIYLEKEGRKPATISRSIASMKAFYHYMEKERETGSRSVRAFKGAAD